MKFIKFNSSGDIEKIYFKNIFIVLFCIAISIVVFWESWGTIGAGHRGVETKFSAVTGEIKEEGLYLKWPLIERVIDINVQVQKEETQARSTSRDLQSVNSIIALNFHPSPNMVDKIYQEFGKEYKERLISPAIQEAVKSSMSKYTAEELITQREVVREDIRNILSERLSPYGIIVDEFNMVDFTFSESFDDAIEAKVTAEQKALESKNKLEQVKYEAQQQIEAAKGRAEAIMVESEALRNNKDIIELRAIEKWDGVLPKYSGQMTPFINLQ